MNTWLYATRITVAPCPWARRCFDYALNYAAEREQFGQPIGKFQGVSFRSRHHRIDAADHLTLASAWRLDENLLRTVKLLAKLYATEMLARITDQTLQIFGGMGLMDDFQRIALAHARSNGFGMVHREIQRHIISRDLLRPLGPNHMAGLDRLFHPKIRRRNWGRVLGMFHH